MAVRWDRRDDRAHWATAHALDGSRVHLVVEKMPLGGWDWAAWCYATSGDPRYGSSPTAWSAAESAENAAGQMVAEARCRRGALAA
jgi:hypothetical protein